MRGFIFFSELINNLKEGFLFVGMAEKEEALAYRAEKRGKLGTFLKTKCETQSDLALACTPGVAMPCKEIEAALSKAYDYTNNGNLVAVVSNGTAVLVKYREKLERKFL